MVRFVVCLIALDGGLVCLIVCFWGWFSCLTCVVVDIVSCCLRFVFAIVIIWIFNSVVCVWVLYGYVCVCLFASVFEVARFVCALFCSLVNDCCFVSLE